MSGERPPVRLVDRVAIDNKTTTIAGRRVVEGFELADVPWDLSERRLVCSGVVTDQQSAQSAMRAVARGVALILCIELDGDERVRFEEDLARVGELDTDRDPIGGLGPEHIDLLDALASGRTMREAASDAHLSRRTAYRRLTEARVAMGATSTAQVVVSWAVARGHDQESSSPR